MICFKSDYFDGVVRKLSWMGIDKTTFKRSQTDGYRWDYEVNELGYKYHGNSVMAAIGRSALSHLDEDNDQRRYLAEVYSEFYAQLQTLRLLNNALILNRAVIFSKSALKTGNLLFRRWQTRVSGQVCIIKTT